MPSQRQSNSAAQSLGSADGSAHGSDSIASADASVMDMDVPGPSTPTKQIGTRAHGNRLPSPPWAPKAQRHYRSGQGDQSKHDESESWHWRNRKQRRARDRCDSSDDDSDGEGIDLSGAARLIDFTKLQSPSSCSPRQASATSASTPVRSSFKSRPPPPLELQPAGTLRNAVRARRNLGSPVRLSGDARRAQRKRSPDGIFGPDPATLDADALDDITVRQKALTESTLKHQRAIAAAEAANTASSSQRKQPRRACAERDSRPSLQTPPRGQRAQMRPAVSSPLSRTSSLPPFPPVPGANKPATAPALTLNSTPDALPPSSSWESWRTEVSNVLCSPRSTTAASSRASTPASPCLHAASKARQTPRRSSTSRAHVSACSSPSHASLSASTASRRNSPLPSDYFGEWTGGTAAANSGGLLARAR